MEKLPEISDVSSEPTPTMTDTALAQELLQEAFPIHAGRNIKAAIGDAYDALRRRERALPRTALDERNRQWTERRVKSIWQREARRIDHYEIEDLTAVAVEEARIERQRLKAREQRLAALIAAQDEGAHRETYHNRGWGMGGRDLPGASGAAEFDADTDQSEGWGR